MYAERHQADSWISIFFESVDRARSSVLADAKSVEKGSFFWNRQPLRIAGGSGSCRVMNLSDDKEQIIPESCVTLRHSFGTLMKANGEDIKTIQELLRHATFKVTADTYTQAVTPVKRDAQARIAKLIMADGSASKAITPTLQ